MQRTSAADVRRNPACVERFRTQRDREWTRNHLEKQLIESSFFTASVTHVVPYRAEVATDPEPVQQQVGIMRATDHLARISSIVNQ